ncbi:MAG: DUF835 domain-containing protein [Thermoplasmata archaeon]|nr:DUF835 domain-containing protein [Thermoplasmata archaeon]MCI4359053.1 DUF835 domain-containing protein [Thermoplasmata archaeon]
MNDGEPTPRSPPAAEPASAGDDDYAAAYSEGYGEGLREALKELLQHASRGHTAQELRFLVESRLARVREDVEVKRRSLLSPPRRPAWSALLRTPRPVEPWAPERPSLLLTGVVAGQTVLVREERPARAIELLVRSLGAFPRVLVVSVQPPTLPAPFAATAEVLRVGPASGDAGREGLSPSEIAGRIRDATDRDGGALVYLDAFEFLATEYTLETSLKFVHWATSQAADHLSALIASVDPNALDPKDASRLQRAFNKVQ